MNKINDSDRIIFVNIKNSYEAFLNHDTMHPLYRPYVYDCTVKYWRVDDEKAHNATHIITKKRKMNFSKESSCFLERLGWLNLLLKKDSLEKWQGFFQQAEKGKAVNQVLLWYLLLIKVELSNNNNR